MEVTYGMAVALDCLESQRVRDRLARLAGNDVVPDLSVFGVFPKVCFEVLLQAQPLRRANLPSRALQSNEQRQAFLSAHAQVEKSRYYSVILCDGNTFIYGYIGSEKPGSLATQQLEYALV